MRIDSSCPATLSVPSHNAPHVQTMLPDPRHRTCGAVGDSCVWVLIHVSVKHKLTARAVASDV